MNENPLSDISPWIEVSFAARIDLELLFFRKKSLPIGEVQTAPLLWRNRSAVCHLRDSAKSIVMAAGCPSWEGANLRS